MINPDIPKAAAINYTEKVITTFSIFTGVNRIVETGIILMEAIERGNKILICGNGGSAADAQHLAAELVGRYKKERESIPAIALTTDTSILTAIGNDYGYDHVFEKQIQANGNINDVLIVISTSGTSKNILLAIEQAKKNKMNIIGLFGSKKMDHDEDGYWIYVNGGETSIVQTVHQMIYHTWCEMIDTMY